MSSISYPCPVFKQDDLTKSAFSSERFSVIVDKGTLDAIASGGDSDSWGDGKVKNDRMNE